MITGRFDDSLQVWSPVITVSITTFRNEKTAHIVPFKDREV